MNERTFGKTALQIVVAMLAATPVLVGIEAFSGRSSCMQPRHGRSISTAISASCRGSSWPSALPGTAAFPHRDKDRAVPLLAACTFTGGLARLISLIWSACHRWGTSPGSASNCLRCRRWSGGRGASRIKRWSAAHWRLTDERPILGRTVCASRQENIFPGALTILRELSLGRPVGFLTRRPPTL